MSCRQRPKSTRYDFMHPRTRTTSAGDFPVAGEEGATLVRVGTAIFGERRRA
jgi:uncharacterized pyridoxal phosphate-containing UPF0001 family protein